MPGRSEGKEAEMIQMTWHAYTRLAHRNLREEEVKYVVDHGQKFHQAGALIYFLRDCDIPLEDRSDAQKSRLAGTAVILSKDGTKLITAWRNRRFGLKHIKQKPKFSTMDFPGSFFA
jgi:hypothetical protein